MGTKVIRDVIPTASGPVFAPDGRVNAFYLHELFSAIAQETTRRLWKRYHAEVPLTAGSWGGSWYFADEYGYTRARFRRLYSLVCVPQLEALNDADNYNLVFWHYSRVVADAFRPYGIAFEDPQWGESIEYSNRQCPMISLQLWDANKKVDFIRCFFTYNAASWEEAYLYETVRLIQQTKEPLDITSWPEGPPHMEGMALRFQLQDIMILYSTLEPVLYEEDKKETGLLVSEIKQRFAQGITDENEMREMLRRIYTSRLIYRYEKAVQPFFHDEGLDILHMEDWPVDRINRVPQQLKDKLLPPLLKLFKGYQENLKAQHAKQKQLKAR